MDIIYHGSAAVRYVRTDMIGLYQVDDFVRTLYQKWHHVPGTWYLVHKWDSRMSQYYIPGTRYGRSFGRSSIQHWYRSSCGGVAVPPVYTRGMYEAPVYVPGMIELLVCYGTAGTSKEGTTVAAVLLLLL